MTARRHRIWIGRLTVAILLFAQGAMAWSACEWLENSPVEAVLAAAQAAPCHESPNASICLTHCLSDRQVVGKVTLDLPVAPAAPAFELTVAERPRTWTGPRWAAEHRVAAGPPRRILLQSFQI